MPLCTPCGALHRRCSEKAKPEKQEKKGVLFRAGGAKETGCKQTRGLFGGVMNTSSNCILMGAQLYEFILKFFNHTHTMCEFYGM